MRRVCKVQRHTHCVSLSQRCSEPDGNRPHMYSVVEAGTAHQPSRACRQVRVVCVRCVCAGVKGFHTDIERKSGLRAENLTMQPSQRPSHRCESAVQQVCVGVAWAGVMRECAADGVAWCGRMRKTRTVFGGITFGVSDQTA